MKRARETFFAADVAVEKGTLVSDGDELVEQYGAMFEDPDTVPLAKLVEPVTAHRGPSAPPVKPAKRAPRKAAAKKAR